MIQLFLIALILLAPLSLCRADSPFPFADSKNSVLGIGLDEKSHPKFIDFTKTILVSDGMTLKQLVADLGPGYDGPVADGVGVISWYFKNNRVLLVHPRTYTQSEALQFHPKDGNSGQMWWSQ